MARADDFRLGSTVLDRNGATAGSLVSVLVDADGFDPKALVIKDETSLVGRLLAAERFFITDEVVVPLSAVVSADHQAVRLLMTREEVKSQKPYISYRLKAESSGDVLLKEAELMGGGLALPAADEIADKPVNEIEVDKDENVMIGGTGQHMSSARRTSTLNGRGEHEAANYPGGTLEFAHLTYLTAPLVRQWATSMELGGFSGWQSRLAAGPACDIADRRGPNWDLDFGRARLSVLLRASAMNIRLDSAAAIRR